MKLREVFLVSLAQVLSQFSTNGKNYRADSAETMVVARQLEKVFNQVFDVDYPVPKSLQLIPLDDEVPPGALQFTYRMMDRVGAAKIISNYAENLPRIDVLMKEYTAKVTPVGAAFAYTVMDLLAAAFANVPLEATKARVVREAIERQIDEMLAEGDTASGLEGFLNNSNVPRLTLPNGGWLTGATPDEIIRDISAAMSLVRTQTKDIEQADTMLLPLDFYQHISDTPRSTHSDTSILKYILGTNPDLKEVHPWYRLSTSGPADAPMGMVYKKDSSKVKAVVPNPFQALPPEIKNMEWVVNCFGQVGGAVFIRPMSAVYMDGLA